MANRYRVHCSDNDGIPTKSLTTATRQAEAITGLAACDLDHVVEVHDGVTGWHLAAEWLAPRILSSRIGSEVATFDGKLTLSYGAWSKEASDRDETIPAEVGSAEWRTAMGPYERVTLTSNGSPVSTAWCQCGADHAGDLVRYERWTAQGREAHGYACPSCGGIVQTG